MSKCVLVIGMTDTGKSTIVKELIENKKHLIYDVQGDWEAEGWYCWPDPGDRDGFFKYASDCSHCCIVCEEATYYLGSRDYSKEAEKVVLSKIHRKNAVFLLYHGIESVNRKLYLYVDYVVLFQTGDDLDRIKKEHPKKLIDAHKRVNKKAENNFHYHEIVQLKKQRK